MYPWQIKLEQFTKSVPTSPQPPQLLLHNLWDPGCSVSDPLEELSLCKHMHFFFTQIICLQGRSFFSFVKNLSLIRSATSHEKVERKNKDKTYMT